MALTDNPIMIFNDTGLKVGGKKLQSNWICGPSAYSVQMSDIDLDDDRSSSGFLNRNRIRQNVYSVTCSFDRLSDVDLENLLSSCQAEAFSLTFRNPLSTSQADRYITKSEMYADANKEAVLLGTDDDHDYWSLSITFVEY